MIRVLHYSTHYENCGIGKFQEQYLTAMEKYPDEIYNEFFPYSPHTTKVMSHEAFTKVLDELAEALQKFDVLHIQHEFSFYWHDELYRIVQLAKSMHKPVVMTIHTAPEGHYQRPTKGGMGPRSILHYYREKKKFDNIEDVHLKPIRLADLVLVNNMTTKEDLVKHGVSAAAIQVVALPVPVVSQSLKTNIISQHLKRADGDIIFGTIGFISRSKGIDHSIKALKYLPANYKLAIIGGIHPSFHDEGYLDDLCDLIGHLKLWDRVYITGYEPDDNQLNGLIRECDACVYPYSRGYYNYVSSGALNNSLANGRPTVAYPTNPFVEMNTDNTLAITKSANYYELARTLQQMDYEQYAKTAKTYAKVNSYNHKAKKMIGVYQTLLATIN